MAKDQKKSAGRKQPNRIQRFFQETVGELRKVSWPTRREATNLTVMVLVVVALMSTFLGLLDFIYSRLFGLFL